MQYLGGKYRLAGRIREVILRYRGDRNHYVEPFVGGGATFGRIAPEYASAFASDIDPNIMALWQAVRGGWVPPESSTIERYRELRTAPPSAERAWYGYGLSYGGKWFGGFIGAGRCPKSGRSVHVPYEEGSKRSLARDRGAFEAEGVTLRCWPYDRVQVDASAVVYCDPPYTGTTGYAPTFDSEKFWRWCESTADGGALVVVSEYAERPGWVDVAPWGDRPRYLNNEQGRTCVTERLLIRKDQA